MSDVTTRYTKGSQLTTTQGDEQIGDINLTYSSATLTLDQTHNREHIILQSGCTAVEFTATATMNTNLDSIDASNTIGFHCKISNNSGGEVTFNSGAVQFNGGTGTYILPDNGSVIIGFDNVSATKGYFIVSEYNSASQETLISPTSIGSGSTKDISFSGTVQRIDIAFNNVSLASSAFVLLYLGTGGSPTGSGYFANATDFQGTTVTAGTATSSFLITAAAMTAAQAIHGTITLTHMGSNTWNMTGIATHAASNMVIYGGNVTLAGALDLVQFATGSTFDSGTYTVTYWRT